MKKLDNKKFSNIFIFPYTKLDDFIYYHVLKFSYSVVLNSYNELKSVKNQFNHIKETIENRDDFSDKEKENYLKNIDENTMQIVSHLIKIMYSIIPFDIIPLFNFLLSLNEIFIESQYSLLTNKVKEYMKKIIRSYNIKYLGGEEISEKGRKIMRKLFDYGIPATVSSIVDIKELEKLIPDNFSINHIKNIMNQDEKYKDIIETYFN